MKNRKIKIKLLILIFFFLVLGCFTLVQAQDFKWLRVSELQVPVNSVGACVEDDFSPTTGHVCFWSWPAQYGIVQTTKRADALWIGCKNFDDPVEKKTKSVKVIGVGPRRAPDRVNQIFEKEIKLFGKNPHPLVVVDDQSATVNNIYDVLDEPGPDDPPLIGDRMIVVKFNTSMGISVTQKTFQFVNSVHGNYVIRDYVFKNTGIYNRDGDVKKQNLKDVYFYWLYRYALAGEANNGYGIGWAAWEDTWGDSEVNHSFGEDINAPEYSDPSSPIFKMRGFYSWRGPNFKRKVKYEEDWGLPNENGDGIMAAAKYNGVITLHADKSPSDKTDDQEQPRTTHFLSSDIEICKSNSQYDETFMADRYAAMTEGHPAPGQHHDELVGNDYPINYSDPRRQSGGGTSQGQGYGPYQLNYGDSIHIVFAEVVAGLSREKNVEVGSNWLQYYTQASSKPTLVLPDGNTTTDHNLYKRRWVETCKDSILKTFRAAKMNYESGYTLPGAPPPPKSFTVSSGGDRIRLTWSNESESDPNFDGYVIYRSQGTVLDANTTYKPIFVCNASDRVNSFDDFTAYRGNDYYYYIQAKTTGSINTVTPGQPIYSSPLWTVTSIQANLQRVAIYENEPDKDLTHWTKIAEGDSTKSPNFKGGWNIKTIYAAKDIVSYSGSGYLCILGNLDGKTTPDADNQFWIKVLYKGDWNNDKVYHTYEAVKYSDIYYVCITDSTEINDMPGMHPSEWRPIVSKTSWDPEITYYAYDVITYNSNDYICKFSISGGTELEMVRVVPNPYDVRGRFFQFGDKSQYDRIAFYGLPPVCKLRIFTETGDLVWERDHTRGTGDEYWDSLTSSGQIIVSGIYILYVETPKGKSVIRKFVVIR